MSIFSWLLLAHLIGDWLLQSDWMALGKRQGFLTRAGLAHYAVYTLTILGLLWLVNITPSQPTSWLITGGVVFVSHWLIDATDLVQHWMYLFGQRNQTMVRIMVDQTLHLLVLGLVTHFF